jgi:hypothetical protein
VPVRVNVPILPMSGGLGGTTPVEGGTTDATVTVTVAAEAVVLVDPLVVVLDVLIVPRLQTAVALPLEVVQVPALVVAEETVELLP